MSHRVMTALPTLLIALAGCALVHHFRYPTGRADFEDYHGKLRLTAAGMSREAFEALWADDHDGYRILASEEMAGEDGAVQRYYIGYTIEYMEAAGRDVDAERQATEVSEDGHERDRIRQEERESVGFWTSYHITAIVTCVADRVSSIEMTDDRMRRPPP